MCAEGRNGEGLWEWLLFLSRRLLCAGAHQQTDWMVSSPFPRLPGDTPSESEPQASLCPFEDTRNPWQETSVLGCPMLSLSRPTARLPTNLSDSAHTLCPVWAGPPTASP
ncbi:unnamed protein product [Gulo gulo]|uniref:Uncharacterized protein n=1 Tax=Gulo gulo TaxID=48420 RepID=A0A9X9LWU6_GULGU|nr:unnamed protein product [Gulo gulo]